MKPIYKKVKITEFKPQCPKCKEMLQGENSMVLPYQCSCGIWEQDWMTHEFDIIPLPKKGKI